MTVPSLPELLATVRAWSAANYPGCPLEYITVHLRYLPVPIQLAEGPTIQATAPPVEERGRAALPDCITDILLTLREHHPRPLTKTRLLEEMFKAGRTYGDSTVCRYLAVLMEDGTIENPGVKARPPGYRLTEEATA